MFSSLFFSFCFFPIDFEVGAQENGKNSSFYVDANLAWFYTANGIDLAGTGKSHFLPTDQSPRNYIGFKYFRSFEPIHEIGPFVVDLIDINPHLEVDFHPRGEIPEMIFPTTFGPARNPSKRPSVSFNYQSIDFNSDTNTIRLKLVLHDFWIRFRHKRDDRLWIKIGHFDIPYGMNPAFSPRSGDFIQPPEAIDIGLKKDWGVHLRAPLGEYSYEFAATSGQGLGFDNPYWFWGNDRGVYGARIYDTKPSYVLSARLGTPSYWDFSYGLSGMFGRIPEYLGDHRIDEYARWRWRLNFDFLYQYLARYMLSGQIGFGQNEDWLGDMDSDAEKTLAASLHFSYFPQWLNELTAQVQFKAISFDLEDPEKEWLSTTLEIRYSLSSGWIVRADYVHDFMRPTYNYALGFFSTPARPTYRPYEEADDRIYFSLHYFF